MDLVAHRCSQEVGNFGDRLWGVSMILVTVGTIWLGHIGMDRMLRYGLKYNDHFQHTHLSTPREHSESR